MNTTTKKNHYANVGGYADYQEGVQQFERMAIDFGFRADFKAEADGLLHRTALEKDKRGRRNGWYVLHADDRVAGVVANWTTGESKNWCAKSPMRMSAAEAEAFRIRVESAKEARAEVQHARHQKAAHRAADLWLRAKPCTDHPYLTTKGISAGGARVCAWPQGFIDPTSGERDRTPVQSLIIPMRDTNGTIMSLAAIAPDGRKDFLFGGRKRGCYYTMGVVVDTVCITEGFATGVSVYDATGYAVAIAFDCYNLLPVALELRAKYPTVRIILCADDDRYTAGNPGLTKATEAAKAINGLIAKPIFTCGGAQ
ncbi:toprim domain-containing protein [Massilia sp. SYSU DXS3249]